jgi:hypothetical protein
MGLNSSAMRTVRGAISFNSPTHFPPNAESRAAKLVMLPPGCARLAAKPPPIGSARSANTIGIVCVSRARALTTGVLRPKIASGRRSTNSFANVSILLASPEPQRSSMRRFPPSLHPSFASHPGTPRTKIVQPYRFARSQSECRSIAVRPAARVPPAAKPPCR